MRWMIAQLNPTIGDFEGNVKKIVSALEAGRTEGVDGVAFPEMALCGYPPEDLLLHSSFVQAAERALQVVVSASRGLMVVIGLVRKSEEKGEKSLCNSAAVICDQQLLGFVDKQLLPTYDVFDERRYFEPGKECRVWDCKGKKIGVLICEDMWQHAGLVGYTDYASDPVQAMSLLSPDLVINISASPYQLQKPQVRIRVGSMAAKTLSCPVLFCCQVGGNDQLVFDGYSFCVDAKGELCKIGKGFEEDLLMVLLS